MERQPQTGRSSSTNFGKLYVGGVCKELVQARASKADLHDRLS